MTGRYLAGRLARTAVTLLGVTVVIFVLLRALPGSVITAQFGTQAGVLTAAQREALENYYGLGQPLPQQYLSWLGSLLTGNLGVSLGSGQSVARLVVEAIPVTFELALLSILISTPVGVALGIFAASRPGRVRDVGTQAFGLTGLAVPEFVLASLCVAVLASVFSYFPSPGAFISLSESVAGNLTQMLYPALVLAVPLTANVMRATRSAYLEAAGADYVRTAHGKGLTARRIRVRHILHNAAIPITTLVGIQFGYLLGGTVIIEQIFALPGLGRLLLTSILSQDYPVVQSTGLVIATTFVLVNFVVDVTYRLLDPRTHFG